MGNAAIDDDAKLKLTYINFCLLLYKEIENYVFSFFAKRIKQFCLSPEAKDYEVENKKYTELKKINKNKSFNLYIEDILEFDPNFITLFQILKKSDSFLASRNIFINHIILSPYYFLSIIKFILRTIFLIIYFYNTIKDDTYVCSYNLAFNYTMTNETFFPNINNIYWNNNSFGNDLFSNYSYWPCKLGKCKVDKVILNKIKILRIVYFILFEVPLIFYGMYFLKTFKKFKFKKMYITSYQVAEYILLLIIFIINLTDTKSCFYSEENPKIFYKEHKRNYNYLLLLCDIIINKFSLN